VPDWLLSPGFLLAASLTGVIVALAIAAHVGGAF
jgi:hypothetical protein